MVPSAEQVRFTGSGTETTWHAVRTARAYTGRLKLVKFEGHFHGFSDVLGYSSWPPLGPAGPVDAPAKIPESAGIPPADADEVIVLPWNDAEALERTLEARGHEIAAVIMEPINYNAGGIMPLPGYLEAVREMTAKHGVVLIFDEILSGFRTGPSCAQGYLGVTPDMCTLGKCLGGGAPISAFAGRRDIMAACAPVGKAVHSGTFNAHPIGVLAADAFLDVVADPTFWEEMKAKEDFFYPALRQAFADAGVTVWVQATGARFNLLFGLDREPRSYREAARCDRALETRFYRAALERGVYFHYSWHHGFSALHTRADLEQALEGIEGAARSIARD
jgi:glutamate-1-semialdehyde 2,1-aminomutase